MEHNIIRASWVNTLLTASGSWAMTVNRIRAARSG